MEKLLYLFFFFVFFSCVEGDIEQFESEQTEEFEPGGPGIVTDASGRQYNDLDPSVISYCGPGWGLKMCRFLSKYDETIWTDTENNYSDFSDIKFTKFSYNRYFISFFNLDTITSYCEGWQLGETTYDGIKWNIRIVKDEEDALWLGYDYYGSGEEIEYTITYKYEVIGGLLNFSNGEGKTFIFRPSERNYSEDSLDTGEIIRIEGCLF